MRKIHLATATTILSLVLVPSLGANVYLGIKLAATQQALDEANQLQERESQDAKKLLDETDKELARRKRNLEQ